MSNNKSNYEAINLYDVKLSNQDVREHINFVLHKEIDMNLHFAYELAFELLQDTDADTDKLEELEFLFISAKHALASLDEYIQMKDNSKNESISNKAGKFYPSLN